MRYAVYAVPYGPYGDARVLAGLARDAEQAGWDGFFFWDSMGGWPGQKVDPWVALAAVAVNTQSIRIGTLVTALPRRRPWKVARETVSVDRLSGGRLIFGAGIGDGAGEYEDFGEDADPKKRGATLDEGLDVLTGLWRGEPFSYDGVYYHVRNQLFLPRPLQSPRIPIWIGGFWPHKVPMRRAARYDGAFILFGEPIAEETELRQIREMVAYVRQCGADGKPFDFVYCTRPTPGNDPAQGAEIVSTYSSIGITWWLEPLAPYVFGGDRDMKGEWPVEAMRERIMQGPPRI